MKELEFINIKDTDSLTKEGINYFFYYHPKSTTKHQDQYSKEMLTFKNIGKHFVNGKLKEEETGLLNIYSGVFYKYFVKKLDYKVEDYMFCLIPPHNSGTKNKTAIYYMSRWSKAIREYFNKDVIVRTKTIEKLSSGGDRSIENQLSSLTIQASVKNKRVVVIDDVTTTGNSLVAAKSLLLDAGAKEVLMFAFAKTSSYYT